MLTLVKRTLKQWLALLLCLVMVGSMLTEAIPPALAAEGDGFSADPTLSDADADYSDDANGRPRLSVDFLGDNLDFNPNSSPGTSGFIAAPARHDQSKDAGKGGAWEQYTGTHVGTGAERIFWVGVGIDRMNVLDLFRQDNNGLYTAEIGFYYNDTFIEPYVGGGDYKATITAANIKNTNGYPNQWSDEYEIITAVTGLAPQTDWVTQENIDRSPVSGVTPVKMNPGMEDIMAADSTWKLTYVALEKKDLAAGNNRFQGLYQADSFDAANESNNKPTEYILMIPFVLKRYDDTTQNCLRLARNAHLFSLGSGTDGTSPYAAWERVTTRNPGRDIKLMTKFTGDLNIFTGKKEPEQFWNARLMVRNGGSTANKATLHITDDPAPNKVSVTANGAMITGLYGGTGLTVDVHCESGYTVKVEAYKQGTKDTAAEEKVTVTKIIEATATQDGDYRLVLPEMDVDVYVTFEIGDATDFNVFLEENVDQVATNTTGNLTTITVSKQDGTVTGSIDSDTVDGDDNPIDYVSTQEKDRVDAVIQTHPDYDALVQVVNSNGDPHLAYSAEVADVTAGAGGTRTLLPNQDAKVLLPGGGTVLVPETPRSDIILRVTYVPAQTYTAQLEVYHDGADPVDPSNVAQLSYLKYDAAGTGTLDYSGVVYHQYDDTNPANLVEDHSAVESPTGRVLEQIDASTAARSGSLGGDGAGMAAQDWTRLMSYVYTAAARADLDGKTIPYDWREAVADPSQAMPAQVDLRKNAAGAYYRDGDLTDLLDLLWKLHEEIAASTPLTAQYKKDFKDAGGKVLYTYYDLTPNQVQTYVLEWEKYDADKAAYDKAKQEYDDQVAAGDTTVIAPVAPTLPALKSAAAADTYMDSVTWPAAPVGGTASAVTTRYQRQLVLTLEADSAYQVKEIKLVETLAAGDTTITPRETVYTATGKDAGYANVWTFPMPEYDCKVQVTYEKRLVHDLSLTITGGGAGVNGNDVELVAFGPAPAPGSVTPQTHRLTASTASPVSVFEGSTVTVTLKKLSGYTLSLSAKSGTGGSATSIVDKNNMNSGDTVTFLMPANVAAVTVTYTPVAKPKHTAYIDADDLIPADSDYRNTALWENGNRTYPNVEVDTVLIGEIAVAPGYYVHSVRAVTSTGAVGYTLSGNGYNNGLGGDVTVQAAMPDDDLHVYVVFAKGPPPEEPDYNLTLLVDDPDNMGEGSPVTYADNWATVTVDTTQPDNTLASTTSPKVSAHGTNKSYTAYTKGGRLVEVEMHPGDGYYVSDVVVSPGSFGVSVMWKDETHVQFYMPGGDVGVTVNFVKGTRPTYFLDLDKTETGDTGVTTNIISLVQSTTIEGILPDTKGYKIDALPATVPPRDSAEPIGAAAAGEKVTLTIDVTAGWYVDGLTITAPDGSTVPYGLSGNGYNATANQKVTATFAMPRGDVSVIVHYVHGAPSADKSYRLDVRVVDPDNAGTGDPLAYVDNKATVKVSHLGAPDVTVGPLGKKTDGTGGMTGWTDAMEGDTVAITWDTVPGYALDYLRVGPAGTTVVPVFTGPTTAVFTMPARQTSVEVHFKKGVASQYTANLILRVPSGADYTVADAGQGTFTAPTAGTLDAPVYAMTAAPGTAAALGLFSNPGYYIKRVTVTPASAGATAEFTGGFASQTGTFVMPQANVYVNVLFEKGWPDEASYDMTLAVTDPWGKPDNHANFVSLNGTALDPADQTAVQGGKSYTVKDQAKDKDSVFVAVQAATGYYVDADSITITGSAGTAVSWAFAVENGVSGIRFTMPPEHVLVQVTYQKGVPTDYTVKVHVKDEATSTNGIEWDNTTLYYTKSNNYAQIHTEQSRPGTAHTLNVTPGADAKVAAAYAVSTDGDQLILPVTQVASGGTVSFAMPDADADVYVAFADGAVPAGDQVATLTVAGPAGSGSAAMTAEVLKAEGTLDHTAATGDVPAGASNFLTAPEKSMTTVAVTPTDPGYLVQSVRIVDGSGAEVPFAWVGGSYDATQDPAVWVPATDHKLTFSMPANGAHVLVTLAAEPAGKTFTAQVIVNDSAYTAQNVPSENSALLRKQGGTTGAALISDLTAGEGLDLDLNVHPGYMIESVIVVPQSYGIVPGLSLGNLQSQTTGFAMPADDVVVYVKFVKDDLTRYTATLDVTGTPGSAFRGNKATIESAVSGKKGPIATDDAPVSVQAAPGVEWVTVEYDVQADSSVESVTVLNAAGTYVPFTQLPNTVDPVTGKITHGAITFPMVSSNVRVIVNYRNTPDPVTYDAVLHVIDLDDSNPNRTSWGQLTWGTDTTNHVAPDPTPGTATLQVPAGETVTVDALADTGVYIQAAYVLFQDHGQMINFNLTPDAAPATGFTGAKTDEFIMHPGTNDVYIYVTSTPPATTDFASVLMLTGPTADKDSSAKMFGQHGQVADVQTNGSHGYITATKDETVTVTVTPAEGYAIASILMSPLGIELTPVRTGNTYTFTMPARNVAAHITLKESTAKDYTATLHILDKTGTENVDPSTVADKGVLSLDDGTKTDQAAKQMEITVPEGEGVHIGATPAAGNTILAAYVMKGPSMVPLGETLEGKTADCATSFTMPNGNVDVYLVFTDAPPAGDWYTAVLVVTDDDGKGGTDSGKNRATFETSITHTTRDIVTSDGLLTHFYTVRAGEKTTIIADTPASGYVLEAPPTITASSLPALSLTKVLDSVYTYDIPFYNSAVHVHFKSTETTKRSLTVRIVDPDNPGLTGNAAEVNRVMVKPTGMDPLEMESRTTAGGIQTIPGVELGNLVDVKVTPDDGYYPEAVFTYGTGDDQVTTKWTLTESGGVWTIDPGGTFPMPGENATVTVTFHRKWSATLTLKDSSANDAANRPYMTEDSFGQKITVDNSWPTKTMEALPNGTKLAATVPVLAEQSRLVGVLLNVDGSTTVMPVTSVPGADGTNHDEYHHTISRADAEVIVVVEGKTDASYLAAIRLVSAPKTGAGAAFTTPAQEGNIWTKAKDAETVTFTVTVPAGYQATVKAEQLGGQSVTLNGNTTVAAGPAESLSFTMPADSVNITVTYEKTAFTATLHIADGVDPAGGYTVDLSDGTNHAVADSATLSGLAASTPLTLDATPDTGAYISGIMLTELTTGKTTYRSGKMAVDAVYNGGFNMPADDVDVTVVFAKTTPDTKDPYTATITADPTPTEPGNAAQSLQNQTTSGLLPAPDLRLWASGYAGDVMLASYTVVPGYYAKVTAVNWETGLGIPVLQQNLTNAGTAAVTMPQADVLITITYSKDPPTTTGHTLTLTLVGHDGEEDNEATLTVEGTPNAISMSGKQWTDAGKDKADPATKGPSNFTALLGDPLYLDAGRRSTNPEYEIYRVTAKVKDDSGTVVEQDIPFNQYAATAKALLYMPDADVEVTVYYRRIYTATLSIADSTADKKSTVSMEDDQTGADPVTKDGEKLTGLIGTEQITTTVTENTATARLVGVLYTSDSKGVRKPTATTEDPTDHPEITKHDFTMPAEDVTVTAVLEPKDGKSHLAWVEFTDDSAHLEDPANGVDIVNGTKTTASNGPLWTAAEKNDRVDLTFHLAEGYQAEILWVSAEGDRNAVDPDKTDVEIYVNRQIFVTDGKTASFSMPDDNAIVLVRFIQGYRAKLEFKDNPQGVDDKAVMDVTGMASITGTSNGTKITYEWSDGTDTTEQDYVEHVKKDTVVTAAGSPKDADKTVRILKHTAFTGTENVSLPPNTSGTFPMPAENTLVSVIMDPNPLIAKVQLKGETDIVGNGADIGNETTPPTNTTHGTIWTTAKEADKIEVSLTVAANYIAVAKVLRDDSLTAAAPVYLTGLASPDGSVNTDTNSVSFVFKNDVGGNIHISDQQTFTFEMPKDETSSGDQAACDVTVIIEFIYAGAIPAPYDPGNHTDGALQEGWIYGENRGGYAVVTVPTLHKDAALSNAHEKDGEAVTYKFFLKDAAGDYVQLDPDTDILVTPANPEAPAEKPTTTPAGEPVEWRPVGSPYNYGEYYTDTAAPSTTYTGVRFNLSLREKDPALQSDAAKQLAAILDNDGTKADTELFILAESFTQEQSAYTQVVIKPYIGITGTLISYAPQHQAKLSLYQLKDSVDPETGDLLNPANYADDPNYVTYLQGDEGTGLWSQEFIIGSSELIPEGTKPIYMFFIEKPGNIPYSHFNLKLDTSTSDYKSDTKTFPIVGDIKLIPGDVSGDWRVDFIDDDYVSSFYYGRKTYTDTTDPNLAENPSSSDWDDWDRSIYNPTTLAYRCDLDGDGNITIADLQLVQDHMRETSANYNVDDGTGNLVKPSGFKSNSLVILSEELDPMANLEELLPEELPIEPEEPSEIDPGFSVDPEEPVDPDFSVDPEEPVEPVDPDFSVDPPAPDDPADLPPTPTDPVLPPEDPENSPGDGETGGGEEETGETPTVPPTDEIPPEEPAE